MSPKKVGKHVDPKTGLEFRGTMWGDNGKGDDPRPRQISDEEWARRWEKTFGKDEDE